MSVAIGVSVNGERDILGLWAGDSGQGAKFWLSVLTEIKNRGVEDVCITVCDGLKGLPEAITTVWELAVVQACIVHLIRNTFRSAARQYWDEMARDLRPVYTAPSEAAAKERFVEFSGKWGRQYPAITRLWENAWSEFVPFLDYDVEILRHQLRRKNQLNANGGSTVKRTLPGTPTRRERPWSCEG
jgi:putative transposase